MDREQAIKILTENKKELKEVFGVSKIGLFGSVTRDQMSASSDIDVVVEITREKKKLHNFLSLRKFLESKLGTPVDLGIKSTLKPVVRDAIKKEIVYV